MAENTQEKIVHMFDNIAPTYDKANRVLSMGVDIKWRKKACNLTFKKYAQKEIEKILDVACGTGDMMGHWEKQAKENSIVVHDIVGIDPSNNMMEVGRKKLPQFDFLQGEAKALPFEDKSVDILSISYGIRNVVEREKALDEFCRVLKNGGYVVILEFTKGTKKTFLYKMRDFYLQKVLPLIGGLISRNIEAYTYLPNSIEGFLSSDKMCEELEKAGFEVVHCEGFSMDISTLFIAKKREDAKR